MTSILLFGPPGVGKGTHAKRLGETLGVPVISTGQIFRSNIEGETELGKLAVSYIDRGELVPDTVTVPMVQARLSAPDVDNGFILDGFPRTIEQAHMLRDILAEDESVNIDVVLELDASEDILMQRLAKRMREEQRSDDHEDIFRHRIDVYRQRTEPVATYYADQDMLDVVDASGDIELTAERLISALKARGLAS